MGARGAADWGIHWPWLKYQQCHCDAGYEGDDCSLRRCPRGDDPETECQTDRGQDHQLLSCEIDVDLADKTIPKIHVKFTDGHNTGKQKLLQFIGKAACDSGSQPLFKATNADTTKGDIKCTVT